MSSALVDTEGGRMKLIKKMRNEREGGLCANCANDFHAKDKEVWLVEYSEGSAYITEPMSLCKGCIEELRE